MNLNCPICNHLDLLDTAIRCPTCGTDTTPFYLLEDIREQRVADAQNLTGIQSKVIYLDSKVKILLKKIVNRSWLIALLLLCCLWQYCAKRNFRQALKAEKILIDSLHKADGLHKEKISLLKFENSDTLIYIEMDNNPSFFADKYYGSPLLHPIIVTDNNITNDRRIMIGDSIRLRKPLIRRKL